MFNNIKLLHHDATPEALDFLKVWIFGIWFVIVITDPLKSLSTLPAVYMTPVGFLQLLPQTLHNGLLTLPFLCSLKIAMLLALLCVIFNFFPRTTGVIACILLTVYQSLIRSFGYINHAELTLLYAVYLWVLFTLVNGKKQEGKEAALFIAIALVLCFSYTLTGVNRLIQGGGAVFQEGNLLFWILENANRSSYTMAHADQWIGQYPWALKILAIGFPFVTVFEIMAPCCLISRPFRHAFLCLMIPFHLINWLFMDILFLENLLLFPLLINIQPWLKPKYVRGEQPVVYFDGVCNLCNGFVNWIMKRDRTNIFKFASLQGKTAQARLGSQSQDTKKWSVVYVDDQGTYKRSRAVIRIMIALGGMHKLSKLLWIVPGPLRDFGYNIIARFRYQIFGKRDVCRLPSYEERDKFLP